MRVSPAIEAFRLYNHFFRYMKILPLAGIVLILCAAYPGCRSGRGLSADEFQKLSSDYESSANAILERRQQIADIIDALNQSASGRNAIHLKLGNTGLAKDQVALVKQRLSSETDDSHIAMLDQVLELNDDICERCENMREIARSLPDPHVVKAGENHYALCLAYLQKTHRLSRAKADSLIDRVALTSDLVEGFHVRFIYSDGTFGTFVSQGGANISPNTFAKVVRRQALEQARKQGRDEAFEVILDSIRRSGSSMHAVQAMVGR